MKVKVTSAERRATLVIHYHGQFLPSAHAASVLPSTPPLQTGPLFLRVGGGGGGWGEDLG